MELVAPTDVSGPEADCLADYDYALPPERIAQVPAEQRDSARLMLLDRVRGGVRHATVAALPGLLRRGDLLVFNDTRVRRARVFGRNAADGAVELLFVREVRPGVWSCLGRPAKRLRAGMELRLGPATASIAAARGGGRYEVDLGTEVDVERLLDEIGELPLPPYIKRPDGTLATDESRYQTIFAARPGAVAAPTAGLHFTAELLEALARAGVQTACLTLHVGPATFLPVREERLDRHAMEPELAFLPAATRDAIAGARREGRRVIAVGTTTTRALESAAAVGFSAGWFWADAFLRPGLPFRVIDGLLTNFHLPKSTLLVLVSAFAGRERVLAAYAEAVRVGYRFYSYGDAMLIS